MLFTLDSLSLGGAELSVLELVKNLQSVEPIVCVTYRAEHQLKNEFEKAGIKLIFLNITERFGFSLGIKKLKRVISTEMPDLVHATHFKTEIISRLAVPGFNIPLIGSLISDTYSKERYSLVSYRERIKLELYRLLNKITSNRSDYYISVAEAIVKPNQKYLGIPSSKIMVISNGRDVQKYVSALPASRTDLFACLKPSDILIVSNSRVIKSKGFDEMLSAFSLLCNERSDLFFLVVGDGYDLDNYKALSHQLGIQDKVIFIGNRTDVPEILKACDIFWFASHYEGSPGVIIEGMLSRLPIIASDIPPVLENLSDGHNALIFPKGDVNGLVNKTLYLLDNWNIRSRLTDNAYRLASTKFNINILAREHESFYSKVILSRNENP